MSTTADDTRIEVPTEMTPAEVEAHAANLLLRSRSMLAFQNGVLTVLGSKSANSPELADVLTDIDAWLTAKRVPAPPASEVRLWDEGMPMHLSVAVLNAASAFARTLDREVPAIETADVVQDLRDACGALLEVMRP